MGYLAFAIFQSVWPAYIVVIVLLVLFVRVFKAVETEGVEHEG